MGTKVAVGSHVWLPSEDPEIIWIDGELTQIQGQDATVVLTNGKTVQAKLDTMHMKDTELPKDGIEDMTRLSYLHEPGVLDNLKIRYYNNEIYTYVGGILIAINPFQRLAHLEGQEVMNRYRGRNLGELPPHVFAVGDVVYRAMMNERRSNSVLVSGESGAGKTEATKSLMRYLAYLGGTTGGGGRTVEEKVLESNPVLEAFGNAKTLRNNNSSRFGKFVEIQFDERGKICGAAVRTYLLERSRICQSTSPERSYHIFYFLCAAPPEHKAKYKVGDPRQYHYLNQSDCFQVDRIDDHQEYLDLKKAMDVVGMSEDEQDSIFSTVAAILHLGNINFVKGKEPDSSELKDKASRDHLNTVAELLKCDVANLELALISKKIVTRDETIDRALDPSGAVVSRDGLAKQLYSRLFDWLVEKINVSIGQDPTSKLMIGVLDIYGFESFKINSFEQLCINFTNEKLQQHFNQHVFKGEQAEYDKEQIDWSYIEFTDNQDILDLIEKKGGVLSLLDEACVVPRGSHETFCSKLGASFKGHKRFSVPRLARNNFTISHFAGDVQYDSTYFLEKNKDFVVPEQNELLNLSQSPFVSGLFPITEASKSAKFSSIGTRFKLQLQQLMEILNTTDPHYVRCVKPNTKLKPSIFENAPIIQQLQCGGVLEAIRISCQGFPTRRTFAEFVKRFTVLAPSLIAGVEEKEACRKLLDIAGLKGYQIGKTKVFLKAGQMAELDARRTEVLGRAATKIERKWKTYITRKNYLEEKEKATFIETICRGVLARSKFEHMRRVDASIKVQKYRRRHVTRKSYKKQVSDAITIQAGLRGLSARMELDFRRKKRAVTKLQARWRGKRKYTSYQIQRKAAITFQSWWRRRLAKKELTRLKIIAKEQKAEQARLAKELEAVKAKMEADRIKLELERMQAERERAEREVAAAAAAAAAEKERKEQEEKERKEREEREEKEKKEREEREARERQERDEREARERKEREEKEARERKEREEKEARERKEREEKEAREKKEREEREAREAIAAAAAAAAAAIAAAEAMKSEKIDELAAEQEQLKAKLEEESKEKESIMNAKAELLQKLEELKDTIKRLEEDASSTEALLKTEKQEHDATKNALASKTEELAKHIEATDKRIEQLQEEVKDAKQNSAAKEELLAERQGHEASKKSLAESQDKNKDLEKRIEDAESKIVQLKKDLERSEENTREKEALLQTEKQEHKATQNALSEENQAHHKTKKALEEETEEHDSAKKSLHKEKQEHDLTKQALAEEKLEHDFAKKSLAQEKQEHNSTKNALEKEKQEHEDTNNAFAKEKREHDSTKDSLSESHRKNKELQNDVEDANKKTSTIQLDLQRSKEEMASTEAMLRTERQEHDTTKRTLASSQQKNDELSRKMEDTDKRIVDLQGNVHRLEDDKSRKESMLENERLEHDTTKRKFAEYQDKNDELMRKTQGAEQRIIELQIEVKRYQEEAGSKEVTLQREKQEHKATKEELAELQANNKRLVREADDATDKCDRLQRNMSRLEETINAKDTFLQKKEDEQNATKASLKESHEKNEGLIENIKDANKKIDQLQENIQRLEEIIASKEAMFQKERQDHDVTKKLCEEYQERIDELIEKLRDANKKIDRLQDNIERLEEAKSSKETLLQEKQQEVDATKKILTEYQEKIEELEKIIKDANKKIERLQDNIERLEETTSSKDVLLQTERQEHDSTKKSLLESHDKNEELMDKTKDANKRADRLQDNVERLQETITSKDTLLQTEKQEHDRTRKLFKESKDKIDELTDEIRDAKKRHDRLQDNVERLEEAKASKEALLQTKQQELDTTKKLLVESEEKIEELEKKIKEANKKFDGLQEDIKRLDETIASKETLLETERQEHETTKKLLKESNNKHEEFMDKIKEANKRADRIQDNVERLGETIALKDTLLQTEKQEHEETKKLLKDLKEKNEELLEQIKDINKKIDRHQDAIQRLEETIATKEAVVQAERLEHDSTKKLLKESKEKYEEISEKTRDADKKCDRLQDKIERLEETITSKDTILQTERQEHDATKKLLKGSQEEIEELGKQIRDYNKKIDRLQDNMERLQESTSLKETSLQKERQELEATKKSLKESQEENDALSKKLRESNKNLDRLQDNAERLEEHKASKEALLQTERQEHDTAKKLLNESRDKIEELELKSKDANKKAGQLQDDIQRLEDIIAGKEESLQSERQEHDTTRKSLKRSQDEYNELLKQIDENRERVNQLHNEMQRLRENEIGKEALLQTEQRLHEITKRELTDSKDKMKELLEKVESTDQRYGQLQLELKRLEENTISKDALVQIEKREHEATQRTLAQSKDYSDELLKRNEVSNNRIDRLQEDIARFEAKVKEMQEEVLKGRLEIYDAKRQSGDNKDLLIKIEDANRNIYQLQDNLRRMEENARENETTLLTEKQQHDRAKKSLASAQVKIEQLEKQISQLQDGPGRVEQGGMANIQSERIQHDATKQAFAESQKRNQELLYKLESSERKIEQLQQDIKRLQENQYAASNRGFTGQPGRNDDYMRADQSYENIQTTQKREAEKFSRQQSFIPSSLLYADDDIRKAYAAAQKRSEELVTQLDEAEKTIDHLQETINILEDKAYNLEQENKMLRQTAVNPTPHLRTQQKAPENGHGVPNTPQSIPRNPMSNTNRDYMDPEEREQNPQLEKQQLESLIKSISRHLGFVQGSPVAANLIYKCLVQWKSFESDKTGAFERIIQTIITATKEVQDDKEPLAYWLSNLSTLVLLLQKTQKYGGGPTASSTQRRFRRAPRGSSVGPFASNMGGGANDAINFTQKVTAQLEKLFGALKEKLKSDISPLLNLCVQAPKVSRMTSMKGVGLSALGPASPSIVQWQTVVKVLNEYMALLKTNYVPHFVIQKLFTETFKIIDVQLFNGLVLRRECCSLSNGEFVKAGLEELERWCRDATDEYVGSTWKELGHIRQAVDFLVVPQKQSKTLSEITNDICHSLTISQIHRLSNLYWDDKYGTNVLSQEATSEMSQIISREPNNTFMLEEDYSNNFSSEELSRSISVVELRDTDLPPQIRNHAGFAFFLQRNY